MYGHTDSPGAEAYNTGVSGLETGPAFFVSRVSIMSGCLQYRCASLLAFSIGLLPITASAQEEMVDSPHWGGAIDFGYLETSGNTVGSTLSFAFDVGRDGVDWRHALHLDAFNQSSDDQRKAEKYLGYWQSNLKINGIQSIFFRGQYDEDKFSTYSAQGIITSGYGHRLFDNDAVVLDLEGGPGYRRSKLADTGDIENEFVVRLADNFKWNISPTATFGQLLSVEEGNENTVVRSNLSLTMAIYKALAVKLAYNIRWNRVVSQDNDNWDRETSISVVYKW
jgi:putative salt-induced outer membrane protein YdiY